MVFLCDGINQILTLLLKNRRISFCLGYNNYYFSEKEIWNSHLWDVVENWLEYDHPLGKTLTLSS